MVIVHISKNMNYFGEKCHITVPDSQRIHYSDVIMGATASQITSLTIVYSTVYSGADENDKASRHWPLCGEFTSEFPAQMASKAENISI